MEISHLFETLTIKELKQQNIKTRTEIECKKEELRFLVGERYRDIIDAADTIFDMKACSNQITDSLKEINKICKTWNNTVPNKFVDKKSGLDFKSSDRQLRLSMASQIKLLLNMSELIWNALENSNFSEAAMLFNLCRNMAIHSQLSCDKYSNGDFNMQLIFSRQWSSLQNLEETIGIIARKYLRSSRIVHNVEDVLDSIVGIVLLEDKSLEEVLKEYMHCVQYQIQEWFSSNSSVVQINVQLCSVSSIIMKTMDNIYQLFLENTVLNRVEELSKVLVQHMDCVKGERIYTYLPEQISKFKPALESFQRNAAGILKQTVIHITEEYMDSYRMKYQSDFMDSFSHLTTIKSVGGTRSELKKIFVDQGNQSQRHEEWQQIAQRNVSEWDSIIYEIYSKKLQVIVQENVSSLFANWTDGVDKFISANENLMSEDEFSEDFFFNYFWTECSKDVFFSSECSVVGTIPVNMQSDNRIIFDSLYNHFSNYFDMGVSSSTKNCSFEALVVKSKVIRPEIYQNMKVFDQKLMQLIKELIDTVMDCDEFLSTVLHECLSSIINKCLRWIGDINIVDLPVLPQPKDKLKKDFPHVKIESDNIINSQQFKQIILCQSVRSIFETFPALQAGLMTSTINSESAKTIVVANKPAPKKKSKSLRLPYLPGKRLQHQSELENVMWNAWNDSIEPLKEFVSQFVICGIRPSLVGLIGQYFEHVKSAYSSVDVCEYMATKWTDMSLANSGTEGSLPITLEVPSQCSWLMQRLLLNICRLLTIFGGHSISRPNLDGIRLEILKAVITQFELMKGSEEFQESKSYQKQNIQLIFDLRLFLEIINAKSGIEKEVQDKLRSILAEIERSVDPFDYQMMNESLHQNLVQGVMKTSSLFLLLSSNPLKKNMSTVQRIETGTNQHNLIDLVGTVGSKCSKSSVRFGMLPISGYMVPTKSTNGVGPEVTHKPAPPVANVSEQRPVVVECDSKPQKHSVSTSNRSKNRNNYLGRLGSNWF